jgi:hypothetical protein
MATWSKRFWRSGPAKLARPNHQRPQSEGIVGEEMVGEEIVTAEHQQPVVKLVSQIVLELFPLGRRSDFTILVDLNVNDTGATADRALLDKLLTHPQREIDRNQEEPHDPDDAGPHVVPAVFTTGSLPSALISAVSGWNPSSSVPQRQASNGNQGKANTEERRTQRFGLRLCALRVSEFGTRGERSKTVPLALRASIFRA